MPRYKDEPTAIRVYTVCDESRSLYQCLFLFCFQHFMLYLYLFCGRYLIVKNVPALGCGAELLKLFASYGEVEEYFTFLCCSRVYFSIIQLQTGILKSL